MTLIDRDASVTPTVLQRLRDAAPAIGSHMDAHDERADGTFPLAAWELLHDTGVPAATTDPVPARGELAFVRAAAGIDVSLGRILDGHLNAVQRLVVQVDDAPLVARELDGVRAGHLRLGVWGADPAPGEGEPARLAFPDGSDGTPVLNGTKTFCSGAGGLQRAFVLVRGLQDKAPTRMAYVDLEQGATTDRSWFRGAGMRGSASHRVHFTGARVLWLAAQPGALMRQPWFSGDAIRTAASWAGGADVAADEIVATLRAKGVSGDLEALAVARVRTAQRAVGLWLAAASSALEDPETPVGELSTMAAQARHAIAESVREILDEGARAVGSRPFATGRRLERVRRDLETYLLQHRLEPILVKAGRRELDA